MTIYLVKLVLLSGIIIVFIENDLFTSTKMIGAYFYKLNHLNHTVNFIKYCY